MAVTSAPAKSSGARASITVDHHRTHHRTVRPLFAWTAIRGGTAGAPVNTVEPFMSGNGRVGTRIRCRPGTWENGGTYTFGWTRGGVGFANPGKIYTPVASDIGQQIRCQVSRTNSAGTTGPIPSNNSLTVAGDLPVNQVAPSVSPAGPVGAGVSLHCLPGIWTKTGTYDFDWERDGTPVATAVPKLYVTSAADDGHSIVCKVSRTGPGGSSAAVSSNSVAVDAMPPNTTIDTGPANGSTIASASASFSFSSEAGATLECKLDAGTFAACTSPRQLTELADGSHTFQVRAIDAVGNVDPTPASRTFTVDTTAPDTSITGGPANGSTITVSSASFSFSSPDGTAGFECRLDSGAYASCTSPRDLTLLSQGEHTFTVRAVDPVGNADPTPASRTFTVDTLAPDTSITAGPAAGSTTSNASPSFSFSSDDAAATFECQLDAGSYANCTSPRTLSSISDGQHTFCVRAVDASATPDPSPACRTFTVDTIVPNTYIDTGPSGPTNNNDPSFAFSSNETGVTFQCRLDTAAFATCTSPRSFTDLTDGSHTFEVRAIDAAGNIDQSPSSRTFTVDTVAPNTQIDSGPTGPTSNNDPSFSFTSPDGTATFECRLDAAAFAACTSPRSFTDLTDGAHTFEVRAVDAAGNVDASPASRSFTVDTVAPDTSITGGPTGLTSNNDPSFTFSSEVGATFECRLDAAAFATCTSPRSFTDIAEGAHTFEVRAVDAAGNVDATPASRSFTVDTVASDTSITGGPTGLTSNNDPSFSFTSPDGTATFQCRLDTAAFASCTSPRAFTDVAEGAHTFEVRAVDAAGNFDATPASRSFTVDTIAPDTSITAGPEPGSTITTATTSFSFTSTDGTATFQCRLDGATYSACTSPQNLSSLSNGSHTFEVRAVDAAGNVDATPASRTFTVDVATSGPETSIDSGPAAGASISNASPSFTFSANPSAGATFECQLDAGMFVTCTSPRQLTSLAEGLHTFCVRATGSGGTDATPACRTFTVDTVAPQTTIDTGPTGPTSNNDPSFAFSSNEMGSTFECRVDAAAFVSCTSPRAFTDIADGAHTFEVRAIDAVGNVDQTPASRAFTVDTAPPDTSINSGPTGLTSNNDPSFGFISTEVGSTFECRLDAAAFAICTSPRALTDVAEGQHTFEVRAIDPAGNVDPTPASRTFTVDTIAPDTSVTGGPIGATTNNDPSFTFTSPDATATFQCRLDAAAFATCTSPRLFTDVADGPHTFEVRAVDAAGNVDATPASRSFTVDTVAPNTTIDTGPSGPTSIDSPSFTFSSNEAGSTFECRLDAAAFATCTSPRSFTDLTDGAHTFEVRATDAAGNVDASPASRSFTVDTVPPDTSITAGPADGGTIATDSTSFSFTSPDATATFECRLDAGAYTACTSPRGLTGLSAGLHTFSVRAVDPASNIDATPASRTFTVNTTAPNTTITAGPADGARINTSSTSFQFSSDDGSATFECQLDGGGFVACTSPRNLTSLGEGLHTFSVRARNTAGTVDPTPATRTFTVDLTPPNTTIDSGPNGLTSNNDPSFTFSSNEAGSTFECRLDAAAFATCTSPRAYTDVADGAHTFEVRATDAAGNVDASPASRSFTVDSTPPAAPSITSGPNGGTITTATATFNFTGEAGATFQCRVDSGTYVTCSSPYTTPALSNGPHTVEIRASDAAGNFSTAASRTFTVNTGAATTFTVWGFTNQQAWNMEHIDARVGDTVQWRFDISETQGQGTCGFHNLAMRDDDTQPEPEPGIPVGWLVFSETPCAPPDNGSVSYTFGAGSSGGYTWICQIHPNMVGTITVTP